MGGAIVTLGVAKYLFLIPCKASGAPYLEQSRTDWPLAGKSLTSAEHRETQQTQSIQT